MTDWQERVVEEHRWVDDKIAKLKAFLDDPQKVRTLDVQTFYDLRAQYEIMLKYAKILTHRIGRFK